MKARKRKSLASSPAVNRESAAPNDLTLDVRNPRLAEYGISPKTPQDEVLAILWKRMAVDEVAMSIATSGYWEYEPLFVAKEGGKDVVVEGNRRLAAVQILLDPSLQKKLGATDLPDVSGEHRKTLLKLPIIRVANRADIWRYLGFKHVNGPAKWRSYAKAQYIAFVHKTTGALLEDIAVQIGDRHRTVQRLYRALMVIEEAERAGVYKRDFSYRKQLAFSHLTTALDYDGFAKFLELRDQEEEAPDPVPENRIKELGEVCKWLWGDRRDDTPPVIESQNPDLRYLDRVLVHGEALSTLRLGHGLATAYDVSKGDDIVFEESLQAAKNSLVKAQGRVSAGYKGEPHLLELSETVSEMASDLLSVMQSKANQLRRKGKLVHSGG